MAEAKQGDTVKIHYTGTLEDGTVFDTSENRDPLEFTLGEGQVISGFESAVQGMAEGDTKTAEIPSGDAYGPRRDDLILTVAREQLPDDLEPEPGDQLEMRTQDGQAFPVRVTQVGEEQVKLDANHPLAGQDLIFEIELVEVG